MKIKNLIRSYSFWTALASALVILIGALGRAFGFEIEEKLVTDIVMSIAGLLVVFGIVTLPASTKDKDSEIEIPSEHDENDSDEEKEGE